MLSSPSCSRVTSIDDARDGWLDDISGSVSASTAVSRTSRAGMHLRRARGLKRSVDGVRIQGTAAAAERAPLSIPGLQRVRVSETTTGSNADRSRTLGGAHMSRFVRYVISSVAIRSAIRSLVAAGMLAAASLGCASAASAHTLVDPTTLTPPLQPFRVCYQDGPWVNCDTSGVSSVTNDAAFELSCGTVYETSTDTRHATRWYR